MKKILIGCLFLVIMLSMVGCGSSQPTEEKIIQDLKLESSATMWKDSVFDITDCEIVTYSPTGENRGTYICNVTKTNDECEIVANCKITYLKSEKVWNLSEYEETDIDVTPLKGISDESVISAIKNIVAGKDAVVSNIEHNFDKDNKTDIVFADFIYEQPYYSKSGSAQMTAYFREGWSYDADDVSETSEEQWDLQPLVGIWQVERDNYLIQYKIISVDESANTVNYAVRYANNGFLWGDGEENIKGKSFSATLQGPYTVTNKEKKKHIHLCECSVYDTPFKFEYGLYCDENSVYDYDDFYHKTYKAIKVE